MREKDWKLRATKRAIFYHPTNPLKSEGDLTLEDEKAEYFRQRWEETKLYNKSSLDQEVERTVVRVLKGGV